MRTEEETREYQEAVLDKDKAERKLKNMKKAFIMSILAQIAVFALPCIFAAIDEELTMQGMAAGLILAFVSYCMAGIVGDILYIVLQFGILGMEMFPILPINLFAAGMAIVLAGGTILFFPIVAVSIMYLVVKHNYKKAERYLDVFATDQNYKDLWTRS